MFGLFLAHFDLQSSVLGHLEVNQHVPSYNHDQKSQEPGEKSLEPADQCQEPADHPQITEAENLLFSGKPGPKPLKFKFLKIESYLHKLQGTTCYLSLVGPHRAHASKSTIWSKTVEFYERAQMRSENKKKEIRAPKNFKPLAFSQFYELIHALSSKIMPRAVSFKSYQYPKVLFMFKHQQFTLGTVAKYLNFW